MDIGVETLGGSLIWFYDIPIKEMTLQQANNNKELSDRLLRNKLVGYKKSLKYNLNKNVLIKELILKKIIGHTNT